MHPIRHPNAVKSLALSLLLFLGSAPVVAQETIDDQTLIATINGQPYKLDLFRAFFNQRLMETGSTNSPTFQEQAFNEFLSMVVAAQNGEQRNLAKDADVQTALELQRLLILSNAALQRVASESSPSNEDLQQAYEAFKESSKRAEYKARHILVDDKETAQELIAQLNDNKGKNFEALAREHSLGPTAESGGDLGWFDARQMVKPFSDAVIGLEVGRYTETPVQTQFGWHVILLEEERTAEPPSLEQARPQLEERWARDQVTEALSKLREQAEVELNEDVVKLKSISD